MTRSARVALQPVFAALVMLVAGCGSGDSDSSEGPTADPSFVPTSIQDAIDHGVSQGVKATFVYVERSDGSVITTAAGIQDVDAATPADETSLFKIASISKLFIAVTTTQLVHRGLIDLDDTIEFWLPALAPRISNSDVITVRQLVQHRSGVPDFDTQPGFTWEVSHSDVDATLEFALDLPSDFAPGSSYGYSNTNYLLLGKILDTALGYSHHAHIQDFILTPLGMADTYSLLSDADISRLAHGYWDGDDVTPRDYVIPGGSMVSTVRDTAVFLRSLVEGDLLTDGERETYLTLYSFGHSGWLPGYQSIARYENGIDAVVVLFVNSTGGVSEEVTSETYANIVKVLRT